MAYNLGGTEKQTKVNSKDLNDLKPEATQEGIQVMQLNNLHIAKLSSTN